MLKKMEKLNKPRRVMGLKYTRAAHRAIAPLRCHNVFVYNYFVFVVSIDERYFEKFR